MDYVELFYSQVHGCYPFNDDTNKIKSQKIIDYLLNAGISEADVVRVVENAPAVDCLCPEILPEWLWEGSLLSKDKFYYHNVLHIKSKPPMWDPITRKEKIDPFFLEMKIRFTIDNLLKYYIDTMLIDRVLIDYKKDIGSLEYLLTKYKKFDFVEPIDFLLSVIDFASKQKEDMTIRGVLDIARYDGDVYEEMQSRTAQAELAKANKIVWR